MKLVNHATNNQGFSLVEVLVAIGLFGIATVGVMTFTNTTIQGIRTEKIKADRNIENLEMLKLFTQPIYFGAMRGFSENTQLKACMEVDTVFCDTNKEYAVTAYDLATQKVLDSKSNSDGSLIKNQIYFKVHCANNANSCDKAEYYTVIVRTGVDGQVGTSAIEKRGVVTPVFNNVVSYVPDVAVSPGRPINIIIFIDNSNSMLTAKSQIKDSLDKLVAKIATLNATVAIYPLNIQEKTISSYFALDGSGNKIPVPPSPLPNGYTYYTHADVFIDYGLSYDSSIAPSTILNNNISSYKVFSFLSTDTAAQRAQKLAAAQNLIEVYFKNYTNYKDAPLCNMLMMLEAPGSPPLINLDPLMPTAMFIITNEDEESAQGLAMSGGCEKSHDMSLTAITTNPIYRYYARAQAYYISMELNGTVDGAPIKLKRNLSMVLNGTYNANLAPGTSCMAQAMSIPIVDLEKNFVSSNEAMMGYLYKIGDGLTVTDCTMDTDKNTNVMLGAPNGYSTPAGICDKVNAGTYSTSYALIPNTCKEDMSASYGVTGKYTTITNYFPATSSAVDPLYNSLKSRINLDNFFLTVIIHPDTTSCVMTTGSKVGTRYLQLANKPGIKSAVLPVCSSDYTPALDKFSQWTNVLGSSDIEISPSVANSMSGVEIDRAGTIIKLSANIDYVLSGTTLVFTAGLVQPNDIIKVYMK